MSSNNTPLKWEFIERDLPEAGKLTVRVALPGRRKDLMIAMDSAKRRHLLIEIPLGESTSFVERSSRGISIQTVDMNVDEGERRNFVDIICLESAGHSALDTIAYEIADALEAGASILRISLVQNVLAKWRRFWSEVHKGLISREQQIGLFGELWFLAHWLGPSVGFSSAVRAWRGPLGSRNDFESNLVGVEVKTSSKSEISHHINGLEQLLEPKDGALFLMSIGVRDEASASESLPGLISYIREMLQSDFDALSCFDSCLYSSGYLDALESEYDKLKLRIRRQEIYRVVDGFPRLIPGSLKEPLALGIGSVGYELNLNGAESWCLAKNALDAQVLLRDFFDDGLSSAKLHEPA